MGDKKHDESAAAMVAVLKYGCGMPLNRLEKLQADLKNPVPASTQWDILAASAITLAPVLDALINQAAQGDIIHNDDTTMKVLAFLIAQEAQGERKAIFTTGLVSRSNDHTIALFKTSHQHAGENLTDLLARRKTGLAPFPSPLAATDDTYPRRTIGRWPAGRLTPWAFLPALLKVAPTMPLRPSVPKKSAAHACRKDTTIARCNLDRWIQHILQYTTY